MKRKIFWIVGVYLSINIVLGVVFLLVGGMQMLAQPTLPDVDSPYTIESDMAYLEQVVLSNESHLTESQRADFKRVLDNASRVASIDELSLIAAQALAAFDNAHTTVLKPEMRRLPLRFHWTSDALVVVKAAPEFAPLLGYRVNRIGNKTPKDMLSKLSMVVGGGTPAWKRYRSEYYYSAPTALSLFGAVVEDHTVSLELESPDGNVSTLTLSASKEPMPGDPFWDFLDSFPDNTSFNTEGWHTLLSKDRTLPLYLKQTERLHALHPLPDNNALYIRMNASFDDKKISIEELTNRATGELHAGTLSHAIVDFRFNRGGDYTKVLPFVKAISGAIPDDGRIYLIVGPNTFSAGIIAATQFKRYAADKLTVVGSEMGDSLRFKAEGFYPTLPYSKIQLYLTRGWTDLVQGCGWLDDCWPPNKFLLKHVGSFDIDMTVENDWASYISGRDRIVEAILTEVSRPRS